MNLQVIAPQVLRATLEADAGYMTLFSDPSLVSKTFGEYVPANVEPPYVTIQHYAGGLDNDAKTEASKSYWRVVTMTNQDEAAALAGAEAIYDALHRKDPIVPALANYGGFHWIELTYPFTDTINKQGQEFIRSGGIYCLRLAEAR